MRAPDYARCSRCKKHLQHFQDAHLREFTVGSYDVSLGSQWERFRNPGEQYVCDDCMWADDRYKAVYGSQADGTR